MNSFLLILIIIMTLGLAIPGVLIFKKSKGQIATIIGTAFVSIAVVGFLFFVLYASN